MPQSFPHPALTRPRGWQLLVRRKSKQGASQIEYQRLPRLLLLGVVVLIGGAQIVSCGAGKPWSVRMAESFMRRNPDSIFYAGDPKSGRWTYEQGVMLEAMHQMYDATGQDSYLGYIRRNLDRYISADGRIQSYEYETFNLDNIPTGRQLLTLYRKTGEAKYRTAADTLRKQLKNQPRTNEGGFWHKKIYPYQMWLDGLYMAEPFYAEYARVFNEPSAFTDIANQILFVEKHTRDPNTGLLYHAWDESRQQRWANPESGQSPHFWGRAIGWYAMALVDVLDSFPGDHPKRPDIIAVLRRLAEALSKFRDHDTGLWYQVIDKAGREGNYLEASASCMFIYALAKGANKGYLDPEYFAMAEQSFKGVIKYLVTEDNEGLVSLHHTCQGAGLGGSPYRDGSYAYYVGERQRTNDFKGVGPFIFAALQVEHPTRGEESRKSAR
jgi:unsaturated rhamnogalacturonyl hydrolase